MSVCTSTRIANGKTKKYRSRELNRLGRKLSRLERPKPTKKTIVKNINVYAYSKHDQIVPTYHVAILILRKISKSQNDSKSCETHLRFSQSPTTDTFHRSLSSDAMLPSKNPTLLGHIRENHYSVAPLVYGEN